jgi:hypothetical protein
MKNKRLEKFFDDNIDSLLDDLAKKMLVEVDKMIETRKALNEILDVPLNADEVEDV